jgi:adenosylhomocysteine nucleosidase
MREMFAGKSKLFLIVLLAAVLTTACARPTPEVIEREVTQIVTQIVRETVEVEKEVTRAVTVEKEATRIVEVRSVKVDDTPRMAVISAFGSELELLLGETEIEREYVLLGHTFTTGKLGSNNVVLLLSGVSMENAAMNTQAAVDHFNVTHIVFSGIAGGVNPSLNIGDVVVAAQWGLYGKGRLVREVDGEFVEPRNVPFPPYGMIYPQNVSVFSVNGEPDERESKFWFEADAEMLAVAEQVAATVELARCTTGEDVVCLDVAPIVKVGGNGVSADKFVDNADYREWVWTTFEADALDMETSAVALVAYTNGVPYVAFRSLSDLAGGGKGENLIGVFFQLAADNSAGWALKFLEAWAVR